MTEAYINLEHPIYDSVREKEKAILVSACLPSEDYERKLKSLDELERLAETAGIETVGKFVQSRKSINSSTYLGKGFLEDIRIKLDMKNAGLIIFDNELSPTQGRNIEKKFEVEVIDRTEIILDIFHNHAKTKEAKLQVKLAELKYQLPRLKKLWSHLDREAGAARAMGGGQASRGMGEKQIEIDRRIIKADIQKISEQLEKIMKQKETQRKSRQKVKKVCLVGYTNAGKSSIFNKLTDADVLVEDKLFATLDSTARAIQLDKGREIIISDTVGFISNLPHHLVASFRATLRDVEDADLLLHVVDISDDDCMVYINSVNDVLKQLDVDNIPQIHIFNKIDLLPEHRMQMEYFKEKYPLSAAVSAHSGENMDTLLEYIDDYINSSSKHKFIFPFDEQKTIAKLHSIGQVLSENFEDDGVYIVAVVNDEDMHNFRDFIVKK